MIFSITWLAISLILLIGSCSLTAVVNGLKKIHNQEGKKHLKLIEKTFFYQRIHKLIFPRQTTKGLLFACYAAQSWTRLAYGGALAIFISSLEYETISFFPFSGKVFLFGLSLFVSYLLADFLPKTVAIRHPEKSLRKFGLVASFFLTASLPFLFLFLNLFGRMKSIRGSLESTEGSPLLDILADGGETELLQPEEKKMVQSIVSFRDRTVREVMVPRINTFCLPATISIREASLLLQKEGYSRTPVYRQTIDEIQGLLMYKDILNKYMEAIDEKNFSLLEAPIETIIKPVLYAPETKKISILLQEFRKKQIHFAVVVDEYGGTEGVVTIEDILEEIVGEIEDEYDEESPLYLSMPDGSLVVDARITIYDLREIIGVELPSREDYDTLGGYLSTLTESIPPKGYRVLLDDLTLEVLSSSERSIGKIRLTFKKI